MSISLGQDEAKAYVTYRRARVADAAGLSVLATTVATILATTVVHGYYCGYNPGYYGGYYCCY